MTDTSREAVEGLIAECREEGANAWYEDVADTLAALLAAVESVLALHTPFEWSFGYGPVRSCKECARLGASEDEAAWPCGTVRAITDVLGSEPSTEEADHGSRDQER